MKHFFTLFLCCLLFTTVFAQKQAKPVPTPSFAKFIIRDTIPMTGVPRDELYTRSWRWFEALSKTNPSLLQEADKRHGRFTGTSHFTFSSKLGDGSEYVKGKIFYTLRVYVDNEYYVYELTDFIHLARISFNTLTTHAQYPYKSLVNPEWHNRVWEEMKEQSRQEAVFLLTHLKEGMAKETDKFDYYKQLWERDPANAKLDLN